jgi:hypothetical protein
MRIDAELRPEIAEISARAEGEGGKEPEILLLRRDRCGNRETGEDHGGRQVPHRFLRNQYSLY